MNSHEHLAADAAVCLTRSGAWLVRWRDTTGWQTFRTFPTSAEAVAFFSSVISHDLEAGDEVVHADDATRRMGVVVQVGDAGDLDAPDPDVALVSWSRVEVRWEQTADLVKVALQS